MQDLIRVLRIKNLSSAGVPLEAAGRVLDQSGDPADFDTLLALDRGKRPVRHLDTGGG